MNSLQESKVINGWIRAWGVTRAIYSLNKCVYLIPPQQSPSPPLQTQCRFCLHPTWDLFWCRILKHDDYQFILPSMFYKRMVWSKTNYWDSKTKFLPPRRGKRTYLTKERTPLFWMLPGSQKAFFSFFFTSSLESSRSIFDSCSQKRWFYNWPPAFEGTVNNLGLKSYCNILLLRSSFWPPSVPVPLGSSDEHVWHSQEKAGTEDT